MYVCMHMYMYTCKRIIHSMLCIDSYMCMSSQSRSRHRLAGCQRRWWQCQRLEMFVWECCGIWGAWTSWFFCSFWAWHRGDSEDRRVLRRKMIFWWENNHDFEPKGVDLHPPRGVTMGRGRGWELPERNDSRNHSRKYSRESWEVTSLYGVWARNFRESLWPTTQRLNPQYGKVEIKCVLWCVRCLSSTKSHVAPCHS